GCRSGKSSHGLRLAEEMADDGRVFMATCVPLDDEMKDRVARHQRDRDDSWKTVETPVALADAIRNKHGKARVILVDCLTLWTSNILMESEDPGRIDETIRGLIQALEEAECPVILVSNEVGTGVVPANHLARLFRDTAGMLNQRVAAAADRVILMTAGIPLTLKGEG
ncbi:MAG: bifunctional adenosylcobinamide kinase/adenosylcobinamide-phosphate guanylyltransferase, partial [Desulfobacterales bacterium]|nr:bifunctional adenosylcobinamide kinase/adenosylcobinamide-phosphate guanylyltransferase [Desulfobacterales bacterium]